MWLYMYVYIIYVCKHVMYVCLYDVDNRCWWIMMMILYVCIYVFSFSFFRHIDYSIQWFIVVVALFAAHSYGRLLFSITFIILIHLLLCMPLSSYHYFPPHLTITPSFLPSHLFLCVLFLIVRSNASLYSMWEETWE